MRLVTFVDGQDSLRPGVKAGNSVIDLVAADSSLPRSLKGILAGGHIGRAAEIAADNSAPTLENARLAAPIPNPEKVFGIGLNYRDHAIESGMVIPEEPVVFGKYSSSVVGPDVAIEIPPNSEEVDYEAELVAVIGKVAKKVDEAEAMQYVAGYTVGNDVSARDWQLKKPAGQWLLGKSFDTFAPIGPELVTSDEVTQPENLAISLRLNGETMQNSSTKELIFNIAQIVSYLSQICTLKPGDLIFTGTPPGVGFARKPPVYLKPGDVCEVEIESLGVLNNPCVAG